MLINITVKYRILSSKHDEYQLPVEVGVALDFNRSDAGLNFMEDPKEDIEELDVVDGVEDIELAAGEYKESTDDL